MKDRLGQTFEKGQDVLFYDPQTSRFLDGEVIGYDENDVKYIDIEYKVNVYAPDENSPTTIHKFSQIIPENIIIMDNIKNQMPELFI